MLALKRLFNLSRIIFSVCFDFKLTGPVRLRIFFERASGAFIKLGQILALRQDFLPLSYTNELLRLLSKVPEVDFEIMEKIFTEEKGISPEKFFSEFNRSSIASGSMAQVYSARLKEGKKVAVKIQRPGIKEAFEADFLLIFFLADILDFFRLFSSIKASEVAADFVCWTRREIDFTYEAKNAEALYNHSEKHPRTIIPKQYLELTTSKVLIQELIEGGVLAEDILLEKITKEQLLEKNINIDEIMVYLIKDEMRQYFIDGFFHADPHPANLIFMPADKLVYLDFGIVGETKKHRALLLNFLHHGIVKKDIGFVSNLFFEFGRKFFDDDLDLILKSDYRTDYKTRQIFKKIKEIIVIDLNKELGRIIRPWFDAVSRRDSTLFEKSAAVAFFKILKKVEEYGIFLPRETVLFFRTLSILDMVALQLSPSFDIIKALSSFFQEYPPPDTEEMIYEGIHESELSGKIVPQPELEWEFFREIITAEKEKMFSAKERIIELVFHYAERHEDIRSMLKDLK